MYTRLLKSPTRSAFVFGPRGVGKSTWARSEFPSASTFDLLDMQLFLQLTADPNSLYRRLDTLNNGLGVSIDEIQRIPNLLNEVHRLIENKRLNVLMTGSSALKLRRGGVNLLSGRASHKLMFPLVSAELGKEFIWIGYCNMVVCRLLYRKRTLLNTFGVTYKPTWLRRSSQRPPSAV